MKLICCRNCFDVLSLQKTSRSCACGQSSGRYLDDVNAVYEGAAVPVGFANASFLAAIHDQPNSGWGPGI